MREKLQALFITGLMVVICPAFAPGAMISFDLCIEFSGATSPAGSTPWMTATIDDAGTPGSVTLTLANVGLVAEEKVATWLFNLDPSLNLASLNFSAPIKTGTFADPAISTGGNAFPADGDGLFDISFDFGQGGPDSTFGAGESVQYTITGISTLTASSFDFSSTPGGGGGAGTFPTAAHVQSIGEDDNYSGWVTVPEPTALALIALGGAGLLRRRRK